MVHECDSASLSWGHILSGTNSIITRSDGVGGPVAISSIRRSYLDGRALPATAAASRASNSLAGAPKTRPTATPAAECSP